MPYRLCVYGLWAAILLMLATGCAHRNVNEASDPAPPSTDAEGGVATASAASGSTDGDAAGNDDFAEDDLFEAFEDEYQEAPVLVADPLEPLNRFLFQFNDQFYFILFKPVTQAYRFLVPESIRIGVRNFFDNIRTPIRLASCILQGKGVAASNEVARFVTNSTIGVLGFWDPAESLYGIPMSEEDLGQTFGVYGIGNGFYFVLPFLGSTTLRDGLGDLGDVFLSPVTYLVDSTAGGIAIYAYRRVNETSFRIGDYEAIKEAAIDPYQAVRDGYIQFRNAKIAE